jgi:predicted RNA-binding protein (virulence factor B family)
VDKEIILGKINNLKIDRFTQNGAYLISEDETEEVLLPNAYVVSTMKLDDDIDVFIYTDSEDRFVATTLTPKAMLNDFIGLEVVDIAKFGIFLDWGLPKDLLLPRKEQKTSFEIGQIKVVRIVEDKQTNRLYATEDFSPFLSKDIKILKKNQEVNLIVFYKTPLGFKVLIANNYEGMVFENEIFTTLEIGQELIGYIKNIREDGKIDVSLQPIGKKANKLATSKVLEILKQKNNNEINFTYKSDSKDINDTFGLSKKVFKKTLTTLIDSKKIILKDDGIELIISK